MKNINDKHAYSLKMLIFAVVFSISIIALCIRIGYIQFALGKEYKLSAYKQQTSNKIISPKRGNIYDVNGEILAQSISVDTVSINPGTVKYSNNKKVPSEILAKEFTELFGLDYEKTLEKVNSTSSVVTIAKKVDKEIIEKLKAWMNENNITSGINIDEDTKRYYPYSNLASNLIGFCGNDNQGLEGLEARWNNVLTGTAGKIVTTTNVNRQAISDENELYVEAENGSNIYLTIDSKIQAIAEKYLDNAVNEHNCSRGGNVLIMEPSTGNILAMATYPDYNLNEPFSVGDDISLWRNKAVTDGYEPGSTFKLITSSIGLEEDLVETDTDGDFYCDGKYHVGDYDIHCWYPAHGSTSLRTALEGSCNPAFMQLGQRIGVHRFYKYLKAYGLLDKTNAEVSGEASGYFYKEDSVGEVELATMSFGQRFTITPLQLITAVSAICNDGILVTPRIVDKIENTDTHAITTVEKKEVRQVVSKETSEKIRNMMQSVVVDGTGKNAQVEGYAIGGKSGTSEPPIGREDEGYTASFIAITPIENTQLVVLVILYDPHSFSHQGGTIAAPVASQILSEVLPYQGIKSTADETEEEDYLITVNNIVGKTVADARKILENSGFDVSYELGEDVDDNLVRVTEQFPKPGAQLRPNSVICLYTENSSTKISVQIPNIKGMTIDEATATLKELNLNLKIEGNGNIISSQDPLPDTSHEEGTIVNVLVKDEIISGQ